MKIGRHDYDIKPGDRFLDNGAIIQLVGGNKSAGRDYRSLVLSKDAIAEMEAMPHRKYMAPGHNRACYIYEITDGKPLPEYRKFERGFSSLNNLKLAVAIIEKEATHWPEYEFMDVSIYNYGMKPNVLQAKYKLKDET